MIPKKTPRGERALPRRILIWLLGGAAVALIALSGTVHQLLLFYLSTLFIGVTSCVLFLVVWQSKSVGREAFYLIIATASLCIGALELLTGAVLKCVPPFPVRPFLLGMRLTSAAALVDAAALFMAPLFLKRMPRRGILLSGVVCMAAASVLVTIAWPLVSLAPLRASGAAAGGIPGGFVVCILLAGALLLVIAKRGSFETGMFTLLAASIGLRFLGYMTGLLGILPAGIDGPVLCGVFCASVLMLYQGIAAQSLRETDRLLAATATALELKHLSGIISICMNCKKIQVREEEWQQIEAYVSAHSRARFSHGICPECARQVFAEMARDGTG